MDRFAEMSPRERLVYHVQELERVEELQQRAAQCVKDSFDAAKRSGYDVATLKVVLKLRKMTPEQRRDRRALEAIYLASLGMLEGESLPDAARRRLDGPQQPPEASESQPPEATQPPDAADPERRDEEAQPPDDPRPAQAPLVLKDPDEARQEGAAAAVSGKRVYDNPYTAGDPCRAAWDEGWCAQQQSHGMATPAAYQRRTDKPQDKHDKDDKSADGDEQQRGAA